MAFSPGAALDQLGDRGQLGERHAAEQIENVGHRGGAPVGARQELDDRHVERFCDRPQDDHGRVALPAFDLREIALGGAGVLRELAARHAALGAGEPHQPTDGGGEGVNVRARGLGAIVALISATANPPFVTMRDRSAD